MVIQTLVFTLNRFITLPCYILWSPTLSNEKGNKQAIITLNRFKSTLSIDVFTHPELCWCHWLY